MFDRKRIIRKIKKNLTLMIIGIPKLSATRPLKELKKKYIYKQSILKVDIIDKLLRKNGYVNERNKRDKILFVETLFQKKICDGV